jgi:hypothetical protein
MRRLVLMLLLVALATRAEGAVEPPEGATDLLLEEIGILRQLNPLELNRAQLEGLRKAWGELDAKRRELAAKRQTPEIRAAAAALRQALLEERPEAQIQPLLDRLRALLPSADQEGEAEEPLVTAARPLAARVVPLLRAQQVVRLVGDDEGPARGILRAAARLREDPEDQAARVADLSERLSRALTGDAARARDARAAIDAFLNRAVKLGDGAFAAQEKALLDEAEQIVNRAVGSPIGVIQWQAEQRIADLLLEPRLGPLLDERLKRQP